MNTEYSLIDNLDCKDIIVIIESTNILPNLF